MSFELERKVVSQEQIVLLAIVVLIVLLAARVPVAFSLMASGALGLVLIRDFGVASATLARAPAEVPWRFILIIIPMFIAMGVFARHAGIAADAFSFVSRYTHRLPGGLALATLFACAGFAAVSGSSVATVATVGRFSIAEMRKHGYSTTFAAGVVGAAGTLGVLIPPSVVLVLYGIIAGESIGELLIAGIIPGVMSALLYAGVIIIKSLRHPEIVGGEPRKQAVGPVSVPGLKPDAITTASPVPAAPDSTTETFAGPRVLVRIGLLFTVVVGGVYSGLYTATEASALGALTALIMFGIAVARQPLRVQWERLRASILETVTVTSMVFALMLGAAIFTFFLVSAGVPMLFTSWAIELDVAPAVVVIVLLLAFVPLGMFLDPLSSMLIAVPLAAPVVNALGFDGVWFGILVVKMIEIGLITPPVGLNAYVVAGTAEDVSVDQAFRGIFMFLPVDVLTVALLFAFPALTTALPAAMR